MNMQHIQFDSGDWPQLFDALNIGVIVVDQSSQVLLWNQWMARHSSIERSRAVTRHLADVFTETLPKPFIAAINRALSTKLPVVLSNALHKYPLPLFNLNGGGERISQSIVLNPLTTTRGDLVCMIQVTDASNSIKREKMLRDHSELHKREATTDALTGLYNRRFFDAQFTSQLTQAQRQQTTLSLIMLDIDYFKNYNDHYGHIAGDSAIIAVADCIRKKLQRSSDLAARYGGEEFIVMLPNSTAAVAQAFAENTRQAICDLNIQHINSMIANHITISVGVSCCMPGMKVDTVTFLKNTDLALYAAKQKGRNQVQYLPL
jgi:diguanylate cyclase (GGDEF)-like protein